MSTTLKQLVDETSNIKNNIIACYSKLKSKLEKGEIEVSPGDKLDTLIDKIPDFITVEEEIPVLRLFHPDSDKNILYELNTDTLLPIKTVSSSTTGIKSIGGGFDGSKLRLFCTNTNNIFELDPDTLQTIKTSSFMNVTRIGGGFNGSKLRLFYSSMSSEKLYEIDPDTFTVIKSSYAPSTSALGIGGGFDGSKLRLFHTDPSQLYEIDPDTLQPTKTIRNPISSIPQDIGGGLDNKKIRIYCTNNNEDNIHELDPDTLQIIKTEKAPSLFTEGIGGGHYMKIVKYIDIKK